MCEVDRRVGAATKYITRRFAAHGYTAICPHLHYREGPDATPDDAAAAVRARGGAPDERVLGDVGGAVGYLRSLTYVSGKWAPSVTAPAAARPS